MTWQSSFEPSKSWWTNKRLFWFAFWAWLLGIAFVLEDKKEYDRDAIYEVTTYRYRKIESTRIDSGENLAKRELKRTTKLRIIGYACLLGAVASSTVIIQRLGRGEHVFRDAFSKYGR